MADVFISYSRRDKVFTQKLVEALKAANRDVWADWEDIPAASDWDAEIKQGIQESNSIVFILSPEWIKSNECRKEMDHAVKMGKRLVPILYLMPDQGQGVPPELAMINWVFMRDADDFDKAFQTLCSAMDTDLDWIKTHTRIQVRALEWEKKNRSASFALRGEDLTEGEQFIATGAEKNPIPTHLQTEYVLASRKDATRRQRQILTGVTVALVVSIALSIYAVVKQREAERQAQIALARTLAAEANAILASPNGSAETAALLSLRAFQVQDEYVPSADAALIASLNRLYTLRVFDQHNSEISTVAYSPKGDLVAFGYVDGTAGLYDVDTGKEISHFRGFAEHHLGNNPEYAGVHAVTFSSTGDHLLVAGSDAHILVWNLVTDSKENEFTFQDDLPSSSALWSAKFSPDDKYILIGTGYPHEYPGNVYLIERSTGRLSTPLPSIENLQTRFISDVEISKDGKMILSTSYDGTAILWDMNWTTLTASPRKTFTSSFPFRDGALSADGKFVLLGGDNSLAELYTINGTLQKRFVGHTDSIFSVNFSPIEGYILTGSWDGTARLWDIQSGKTVRTLVNHKDDIRSTAFSPDGKYVVTGSFDHTARIWSADPVHDAQIIYGHSDRVNSVSYSPDGNLILSASRDNTVRLWDARTLSSEDERIQHSNSLLDPKAVFSSNGRWIAAASEDYQGDNPNIVFWERVGSVYPNPVTIPTNHISSLAFSPSFNGGESEYLLTGYEDSRLDLWQVNNGNWEVVKPPFFGPGFPTSLIFTPDSRYFASTNHEFDTFDFFDIQNPDSEPINCSTQLSSDKKIKGSWTIAFSNNTEYLAANLDNKIAILKWQESPDGSQSHECVQERELPTLHSEAIRTLGFSPKGNYLLSTSLDGTAILWDARTWEPIRTLTGHEGEVTSAGFSPDGTSIVTGGADKTIRIWHTNYEDTVGLVCSLLQQINRDLTREERAKYGITDNNPTCDK